MAEPNEKTQSKPKQKRFNAYAFKKANDASGKKLNLTRDFNPAHLQQFSDSLTARGYDIPQQAAFIATSLQEQDENGANSRGVGGNGLLGLSESRMPLSLLGDSPDIVGKQIHHILEDATHAHSGYHPQAGNWMRQKDLNKSVGIDIASGKNAMDTFFSMPNTRMATILLNNSYIRPAGLLQSAENRAKVAENILPFFEDVEETKRNGGKLSLETIRPKARGGYKNAVQAAMQAQRQKENRRNFGQTIDNVNTFYGGTLPEVVVTGITKAQKDAKEARSEMEHDVYDTNGTYVGTERYPTVKGLEMQPMMDMAFMPGGAGGYELAQGVGKGLYGLTKAGYKIATRPGWLAQHVYEAKEPFGYTLNNIRIMPTLKKIIKGQDANTENPWWQSEERMTNLLYYLDRDYYRRALRTRDAAYRKWARLPEKEPIYLANGDGTYSYNMPYLRRENLLGAKYFRLSENKGVITDYITAGGNAGNMDYIVNGNNVTFTDPWDLMPLQAIKYLPKKLQNIEVSKFVGGKPFKYKQTFPLQPGNGVAKDFKALGIKSYDDYVQYMTNTGHYAYLGRNQFNQLMEDKVVNFIDDFRDGGSIHIKPSHRGRLTELKERTGKSEAELYADGSPAVRKMVIFARNARKWNHRNGGKLSLETI